MAAEAGPDLFKPLRNRRLTGPARPIPPVDRLSRAPTSLESMPQCRPGSIDRGASRVFINKQRPQSRSIVRSELPIGYAHIHTYGLRHVPPYQTKQQKPKHRVGVITSVAYFPCVVGAGVQDGLDAGRRPNGTPPVCADPPPPPRALSPRPPRVPRSSSGHSPKIIGPTTLPNSPSTSQKRANTPPSSGRAFIHGRRPWLSPAAVAGAVKIDTHTK